MRKGFVSGLALLLLLVLCSRGLLAVTPAPTPEENPTGNTGALKTQIETGGSYVAHSGNGSRIVTDLHVPDALGVYGLDFIRYWNSLHNDLDDPHAEWVTDFGMSGWSHSWRWHAELVTYSESLGDGEEELFHTQIVITFPDGHTTKYKIVRSNRPHGIPGYPGGVAPADPRLGPYYTQPEIDFVWRYGGLGVHDHITRMDVNGLEFWLSRADGGSVHFVWGPQGYQASEVFDPHGLKTVLQYNANRELERVTQDGGRYLNITWSTFTGGWRAITRVESGGSAGAQYVTYSYKFLAPQSNYFLVLAKVGYPNDQAPGQSSTAAYTYGFDYGPNVSAQSAEPLLKFADDPRFSGPMTKIRYEYNGEGCGPPPAYPEFVPEYIAAQPYAIAAELSGDTDSAPISRFLLHCSDGTRKEENGLGGWRMFYFGNSAGTFESAPVSEGGPFKCRGFQLGKVTDFTAVGAPPPAFHRQNFASGDPRHIWDGRNLMTEQFHEPADESGLPKEIHHPDNSREFYDRVDSSGSDALDSTRMHNPYNHWLFRKTDERNQATLYRRDGRRRVKRIDYPDGSSELYTYNEFNQVETHTLPSLAVQHYEYDGFHRLYREWNSIDGPADYTEYSYDTLGRVAKVENPLARSRNTFTAKMEYNGRHLVTKVTYPATIANGTDPFVTYEYDKYGNCTAITDELGHRRVYTYDSYRRCTSYTEPLNAPGWNGTGTVASRRWDWIYDRIIDYGNGVVTGFGASAHTSREWRVQIEPAFNDAAERRMTARWFDVNNRIALEESGWIQGTQGNWYPSPDIETRRFTYDENGQKSSFKDPLGRITDYTYNNRNWLWKTIEHPVPGNNTPPRTTETRYNAAGDKTLVIFPDLTTQQWPDTHYDAFGQPHVFIDERQHTTNLDYWPWGPMKKLAQVTTHRTNDDGVMEHQETRFYYDRMGRPQTTLFPDNSSELSTYKFGQLESWKTRKNQTKWLHYDARGREDSHTWDNGAAPGITRVWDNANRLTNITNAFSAIDYGYDDAAQAKWEGSNVAGSTGRREISYWRYPSGEVSRLTYPNGTAITRRYTARGQLESVHDSSQQLVNYSYLRDGKVDQQDYANGVRTKFEYNGRGMIFSMRHKNTWTNQNLAFREYWRDDRDRITAWKRGTDNYYNGMEDGRGDRYQYDPEGQLERAWYRAENPDTVEPGTPKRGDHFQYDELGNRKEWNNVASRGAMLIKRKDTGLNQYFSWENSYPNPPLHWGGTTNYDADLGGGWGAPGAANGVLMQDGHITASFNALNQPMGIWAPAYGWGDSAQWMWSAHDPLGRCVKRWMGTSTGVPAGSVPATYYYYDGWSLLQEGPMGGTASRLYVHGGRIDEMVKSVNYGNSQSAYHHYDARGHCILLSNASGGILEQYDYDAFGLPYFYNAAGAKQGQVAYGNRFLFTGREYLSDLKLYDYRNRMYQPELGRFLQPDPKQFAAGDYNIYRYCHNDPVNKSDPTGLDTYQQNRELGGDEVRSNYNPFTHSFTFTTHPDGSIKNTYSWGNTANPRGWNLNQREDIKAAETAMASGRTNKVGESKLDPYVDKAFAQLNKKENEHYNPPTCKVEAAKLLNTAKEIQKADNKAAEKLKKQKDTNN